MINENERYQSPFSARYSSDEMQYLFSAQFKFSTWRKLWVILAESEQQLGLPISDEQIAEMRAHTQDIDFSAAASYEKKLRHDVMAHIHTYGDACPSARAIIHLGATSCYVGDNTDIIIMNEALKLVRARLAAVARALARFCESYKSLPALGFTHFQPAQPVTVGKRAALWLNDILLDLEELEFVVQTLRPLGSKGTTGTQASFLELFEGDYEKVRKLDELCAQKMGFAAPVSVSGQTYSRKTDSRVLNLLSQIAQSAHKFSNDMRLLASLKEIEEPFESGQIGSSAMAYKRNPMRSERIASLSRLVISNAQNAALTAASQWFERTLDDTANRRVALSEGFLAVDAILLLYENIAFNLVVYQKVIEKRLRAELPFMATENILMNAVKKGGDRQYLHERIRVHSVEAGKAIKLEGRENDVLERIAGDPAFGLTLEQLEQMLMPESFTGCAERQVEDFLINSVYPVLERYKGLEAMKTEIRV